MISLYRIDNSKKNQVVVDDPERVPYVSLLTLLVLLVF